MIDLEEIDVEIARLEFEESSYPNYHKLATLYTIREQQDKQHGGGYSQAAASAAPVVMTPPVVSAIGDSDFLQAVSGKNSSAAWAVMDDLMDTLRVVNDRVYERVMEKIKNL